MGRFFIWSRYKTRGRLDGATRTRITDLWCYQLRGRSVCNLNLWLCPCWMSTGSRTSLCCRDMDVLIFPISCMWPARCGEKDNSEATMAMLADDVVRGGLWAYKSWWWQCSIKWISWFEGEDSLTKYFPGWPIKVNQVPHWPNGKITTSIYYHTSKT